MTSEERGDDADEHCAWLTARRSSLEVGPAPYTHPAANEIVVGNRTIASSASTREATGDITLESGTTTHSSHTHWQRADHSILKRITA